MLFRLTIVVAFTFLSTLIQAQSWRIDKIGLSDGLSEGFVYAIHQDKKGFIWIGTHGGLNRYDGYDFRVFQYIPFNASSLGDNGIFFMKEDSSTGKFWLGGSSCLNEFDPETFTNIRHQYKKRQQEFADGIFINDHEILLACQNDVLLFNTKTHVFSEIPVYDERNVRVTPARMENVATDKKGNLMIMSKTGVFFYDRMTKTCRRKTASSPDLSPFYNHEVFNVLEDSQGDYWIATNKKGLIRYNATSGNQITLNLPSSLKNESTRFDVAMEDSRGIIWAGGSDGLFKVDRLAMTAEHFSSDLRKSPFLSHSEVNVVMEDRNHYMWIGTVGGGVNKMIPQNAGFRHFTLSKDTAGTRTGSYTMGLQQIRDDIWFINIWDQIGKVNIPTGKTTMLARPALPASYTWYSEGVVVKNEAGEPVVLNGENLYRITSPSNGKLSIVPTASPGLFYIHHSRNGKAYYMVKTLTDKIIYRNDTLYGDQFFFDAVDDDQGNIWIGTSRGLLKFATKDQQITQFRYDDKNPNSVSSDFLYSLEIDDSSRNIWMAAYNGGLCSYNIREQKFRHYSREDGLPDNIVYAIEKDHHGNFWFTSNAGISMYNANTKIFRNYGVEDGLLNNEFNRRSSFKNDKGWIFFGGIFGIDYFHPDSISQNTTTPGMAFTRFRVVNNDYLPEKKGSIPLIELSHNNRYMSVDFASLDFNDQRKIQYAYRLDKNQEWIKLGHQHSISFSGLPTGKYNLSIRSTNTQGNWLDNEITCLIVVHPAIWQTTWFRLSAIALLIIVTILIIRIYYQRKLEKQKQLFEKQQAVQHERTRIATDMHDDMGAGLSRIKFLSETIGIKKQRAEPIEEDISKIREYSHSMIDKMGEIVWALNEKNDSLSDLLSYTRAYAVEYLSQNGIETTVDAPDQFPTAFVSGEFRRNIYLVVKEALHNIVKHAQATHVSIRINTGSDLTIRIRDNGKGFDETKPRPFSNGFSNMKKRMATLGGELDISNEKGTVVNVRVPL